MESPDRGKSAVADGLVGLVGRANVVLPEDDQEPYVVDWRGRYRGRAEAVVRPALHGRGRGRRPAVRRSAASRSCRRAATPACAAAATPSGTGRSVVVRLDRMRRSGRVDPLANTITVEAGCILQEVQEAAAAAGRLFPLSLGAEGSCQIGGNISTNAGGTAVLRYGTTRDLVLGLEVVLPDGRVFEGLRALRKDNTGYDLKQLFIGAEGTLGIVTAAVLKLFAPPRASALAMVMLDGLGPALELLGRLRAAVGERLGSLEVMSRAQIEVIAQNVPDVAIPFGLAAPWYLLIELTDTFADVDLRTPLEEILAAALEDGLVEDALVPSSEAQAKALWRIRHSVSEGSKRAGYVVSHDSAVPLENQAAFVTNVERRILAGVPDARVVMHGHIGDGNIHVLAILPYELAADADERARLVARINEIVDDETRAQGGAISAEHGIGLANRARLARVTDPVEIELMRRIKAALDPDGLMNPDKIFEPKILEPKMFEPKIFESRRGAAAP